MPLSLENYDFAKAVKLFSDAESVRRNEILQQFSNGTEREYYRNSTMTAEELQKVVDTKRTEVVNEIAGKSARRFSMEDAYSYDTLTKKAELNVVTLSGNIPMTDDGGKFDNKKILDIGRNNAKAQENKNNTATSTYVYVKDIGVDVLIGSKGMQHGLERNDEATARAVMYIGDVLANSVAVNEIDASLERKTEMSYVLLTACEFSGDDYVVRSVVSKEDNSVSSFDLYKLGAVKGKKTDNPNSALKRGAAVTGQSPLISSGYPTISITDFLQNVKSIPLVNEVFSADVAKRLGIIRSKGTLTPSLRYSSETIENVGKSRFDEPDVKFREKIKAGFVSVKDKLYIEAVDELYGVEKYLTKFGGRKDAESFVQQVRALHMQKSLHKGFIL